MEFRESRIASFFVMLLVYAIACISGILIYHFLTLDLWLNLLITDICATVIIFLFSVLFENASVYDPYWSVLPIVVVVGYSFTYTLNTARILMLIAVCVWGVRLTANWAYTFKNLLHQDWRYTMIERKTGDWYPIVNFLGIHMFPTLVVYACILPVVYTFHLSFTVNVGSIIFFAVSILAVILQSVSDCQMHVYRRNRKTPFIRVGLWKYSRHPNYLGEIIMWWGVALAFVCANPFMWYLIVGAIVNTIMFLVVSIPMADKRQSRKNGFSEYKKQTRMLLPIPKKTR